MVIVENKFLKDKNKYEYNIREEIGSITIRLLLCAVVITCHAYKMHKYEENKY